MPGTKDIDAAYKAFRRQHPRPRPSKHEAPNGGITTQEEPTPSAEGWAPPTILLLAPNSHKHATSTVQRHHTPWSIPKHNAPQTDVPPVRHSDQGIPRTCWHCGPAALDTQWPLLHLISTHYHTPTAAATAYQQAWLSPWFHTVPPDHPAHVAWTRTPTATSTFTNERADPDSVAMEYDRCDPHRAGPQEAPMRPLQHKCPTLCGDKDDKERRQTITCQKLDPHSGYLFHLMYAHITQGRPDRGFCLTPRAQAIITQGIGIYAAPLLQPTQITTRTAQGNPVYVYYPTAIARLPIPSDTNIIYFTAASGTQQRTPTNSCAAVRITRRADGLHVEHQTRGHHLWGVLPRPTTHPRRRRHRHTATRNDPAPQHLGSPGRHRGHPPHQAPCGPAPPQGARIRPHHTSIGAMDGLQGHAPPGRPTHRQTGVTPLHIRQWTRRHASQTPEHQPHPGARTCTTGHSTPQPPATPTPNTPGHTAPPLAARGQAVHRWRQAVPLPHTHPAAGHHTGQHGEHRTPPTPRRLRPQPPLLLRPTPG